MVAPHEIPHARLDINVALSIVKVIHSLELVRQANMHLVTMRTVSGDESHWVPEIRLQKLQSKGHDSIRIK
jgi:hypothetical protein